MSISKVRKSSEPRHRAAPRRSLLFRVLRWGLAAWLFYLTKPWRQVIQCRLSVADRCREYNTIYHSHVRGRLPVYLNDRAHQDRRQQRNHCHRRSQMHGLTRDFAPTSIARWHAHKMPLMNQASSVVAVPVADEVIPAIIIPGVIAVAFTRSGVIV
jgi:hypothetical protein